MPHKAIGRSLSYRRGFIVTVSAALMTTFASAADAQEIHHQRIEVHHIRPHGYARVFVPRERFYRGLPVIRHHGPVFRGYGYYYDDVVAWPFLGFTVWELAIAARLNEEQMRAHEAAIVEATTAPVNDVIEWNDGSASGTVTTTREGKTADGRPCREFQQQVIIDGNSEKAYGTACRQPDGSWQIVRQ